MTPWRFLLILGLLGLAAPAGAEVSDLRVGEVRVRVVDIYGVEELEDEGGLVATAHRLMNAIHPGTRHAVIRRELLFREGDPLDPALLRETERNLRSLGFLTNVSVAPADTLDGGVVPVQVTVQETWSLRTTFSYSRASNADRWLLLLSDSNFLGYGLQLEAGLGQDEDRDWKQLRYESRRLLGSDWRLKVEAADLSDGLTRGVELERPYYADDDPWTARLAGWDVNYKPRYYLGDATSTEANLYANPHLRWEGMSVEGGLRLSPRGDGRLWRLGLGFTGEHRAYAFDALTELSDDRVLTREEAEALAGDPLRRESGRTAEVYLLLETQGRRWAKDRFVRRYGAEEDIPLDPVLLLRTGPALEALGSDRGRWRFEAVLSDWSRLGRGWWLVRAVTQGALGGETGGWHATDLITGWTAHQWGGVTKIFAEAAVAAEPGGTDVLALGLTRGLRTSEYSGMVGDRLARWTAEHSVLLPQELLGFYRVGVAGFYAGGSAWWHGGARDLGDARHEAGIGLRFGPTRSARAEVSRLDVAWPLDGSSGPKITAATGGYF
ncbi:MAG TPA: POTRA domain-containing protein [Candidatus Krumholzibacteria bacterium]|nr:POTRA domain-containing protein [Candidatus Krumholzibacteria bacterium]